MSSGVRMRQKGVSLLTAHQRHHIVLLLLLFVAAVGPLLSTSNPPPAQARSFDLDSRNAAVEVVIPAVIPVIYGFVSPTASDAPLVLRITTLLTNGWFDAIAPYHPTAVGVYSNLGRQPMPPTNREKNIAILYASYRVLNSLFPQPQFTAKWNDMLASVGLDPADSSTDLNSPVGIGNAAGNAVVHHRERDGMNQLGDEGGRTYNRRPYADYLGYVPVNTAYELADPSRWQPLVLSSGNGLFTVQQFVTPQLRLVTPYSYDDPNQFRTPRPVASILKGPANPPGNPRAYRRQVQAILAASASLTDEQKMTAELFDNKIESLGFSALFASQANALTLDEFVHLDFLANLAAFDTAIAVWNEKHRHDAVRPVSAVRYLYGDKLVTAWGGLGRGTVSLPASEWQPYLPTANHPEYPSGSAAFCAAHAQASRRFFRSDTLNWVIDVPQGSSRIEPGVTPAAPLALRFDTWTTFEMTCGQSRLWAGVHFPASLTSGRDIGHQIGDLAYGFVQAHITGTVTP
jgi:hypothetical protein